MAYERRGTVGRREKDGRREMAEIEVSTNEEAGDRIVEITVSTNKEAGEESSLRNIHRAIKGGGGEGEGEVGG